MRHISSQALTNCELKREEGNENKDDKDDDDDGRRDKMVTFRIYFFIYIIYNKYMKLL